MAQVTRLIWNWMLLKVGMEMGRLRGEITCRDCRIELLIAGGSVSRSRTLKNTTQKFD